MSNTENEVPSLIEKQSSFPVLPLRDVVVYPHMVIPLFVGRGKSIKALEAAMLQAKQIFLVAQKKSADDDPAPEDVYEIGTLSSVLQLLKLPDGTVKVLVEGEQRAKAIKYTQEAGYLETDLELIADVSSGLPESEIDILMRSLLTQFEQYIKLNKKIPPEVLSALTSIEEPGRLGDAISAHLTLKVEDKQKLLEIGRAHV